MAKTSLNDVRKKYLDFFASKQHAVIASAPLVPENDPTTLFTGSGMQPLVPYLLGEAHPAGIRLADSQKCFRSMDIEEIGDNRHTTFFEMLGNWSLGDYFKQQQIPWIFEFLVDELGLNPENLYITCFIGAPEYNIPKDSETAELWQKLFEEKGIEARTADINSEEEGYQRGIKAGERIFFYEDKKNWWNRGKIGLKTTPIGDPCGPDSEMFYEFTDIKHDEKFGQYCHPNCDCGRFMEIGNNVFMAYKKQAENSFVPLEKPNIDHGSGLERIAAAVANNSDVFPVAHGPIIAHIENISGKKYEDDKRSFRIIADHMKATVFLIADGVMPSKSDQGYFVRRLIRRSVRYSDKLGMRENSFANIAEPIAEMYKDSYREILSALPLIKKTITEEEEQFRHTLGRGMRELSRITEQGSLSAEDAFRLFTTYGFPLELILEEAQEKGIKNIDEEGFKQLFEQHQNLSRAGAEQKFKGGLIDHSDMSVKYHTATHLLHKALKTILGDHVQQKGSNITPERLRFDFSHPEKMTPEQIKQTEDLVNEQIQKDMNVSHEEMSVAQAKEKGALGLFEHKYGDIVSVYTMGDFSCEICGGPHVEHTGILGTFKITKEESASAGVRRIKAILE